MKNLCSVILLLAMTACGADPATLDALASVSQAACTLPPQDPVEQKWLKFEVLGPQLPGNPCATSQPKNSHWAPAWAPPAKKDDSGAPCLWRIPRAHAGCGGGETISGIYRCAPASGSAVDYTDAFVVVPFSGGGWIGAVTRYEKKTATSPQCQQVWNVLATLVTKPAGWPP